MTTQFTWIPIYQELADELSKWQNRQAELISFLEQLRVKKFTITPFTDKDEDGANFLIKEIDPFTFFGVFNRGIREDQRIAILNEIKRYFNLQSELPSDFFGVPILNNQKSWFFGYKKSRDIEDIGRLWHIFQAAFLENPLEQKEFSKAFDDALNVNQTNVNLTMGLYWIRPNIFLNLDHVNRKYLDIELPSDGLSAKFYLDTIKSVSKKGISYPEISFSAWKERKNPIEKFTKQTAEAEINYWLVGAYWDSREPSDQTGRFLSEGIWENGYEDKYLDKVKSIKVGDKIGIKSSGTQRLGLPFDNRNKTISRNTIKARGTVVANRGDGRTIEVEWDPEFQEKNWYFYTHRGTIWRLRYDNSYNWKHVVEKLINFVCYEEEQDFNFFTNLWWGGILKTEEIEAGELEIVGLQPYSIEDVIASGVFLTKVEIEQIIERLQDKKSIIIQGPPGVGKTFVAQKIAFALMQEKDPKRLEFIQFHQSYSYDDFIRGYRPNPDISGSFKLINGIFFEFCQKAINDPDQEYVFIIDEINRGNLSQIFGELLMLIEQDKRGEEYSLPLIYHGENEPRFYVPNNLYLIGLMNLADRSLAMVDFALRRRFGFIDLSPQFERNSFVNWLTNRSMKPELIQLIQSKFSTLNRVILEDPLLGENYQIGHSYFCPNGDDFSELSIDWYKNIIKTEIVPLLKEYWFDNRSKAEEAERILLA